MNKATKFFIFLLLPLTSSLSFSATSYYEFHARGWHWYEQMPVKKEEKTPHMKTGPNPREQLKALQQQIENAKAQAILHPTIETLSQYITLQNQVASQSSLFARVWQRALLTHPELNFSIDHPTAQLARQAYYDEKRDVSDATITEFAKTYGLFYFYKSTCPYCKTFSPIIKGFAKSFGFTLIAISVDGGPSKEFPEAKKDKGQSEKFNVTKVPAVFAIRPSDAKAIPISFGFMSAQGLRERFAQVISELQENEHA